MHEIKDSTEKVKVDNSEHEFECMLCEAHYRGTRIFIFKNEDNPLVVCRHCYRVYKRELKEKTLEGNN